MGKTRDLCKKIRETKGIFHAMIDTIKDRNGMDLTEAEDIKNRWQVYTEELYRKALQDPDNHDGVITHLEPYIQEWKVKWSLGIITTNKASRGVGNPVELFQILNVDAVKVLHSICQQFWKTQHCHRTGKDQFSFQSQRNAKLKNAQTTAKLHSSHMLAKKCSTLSKPGFNSTWTVKLQRFKLDLEKTEEPEIKLSTSIGSSKKWESSRKTSTSALLNVPKPLTVWITINCGKFFTKMGIPDHLICLLRSLYSGQEATVRTGHETAD